MFRRILSLSFIFLFQPWSVSPVGQNDALYFSDQRRQGLFRMSLGGGVHTRVPVPNLLNPIAVAYNGKSDIVYVTERGTALPSSHKFISLYQYNSGDTKLHTLPRSAIPDGMAFDPISQLVYYSNTADDYIGALTADLAHDTVIISEDLQEPRAIALDPLDGLIFWTDWSAVRPHIGRANMDGSNQRAIVTRGLGWPNGITLDTTGTTKYLYWCDARDDVIMRSNTDGSDLRQILKIANAHFFGIVVDETYIYFTDWHKSAIQRLQKDGLGQIENLGTVYPVNSTKMNGLAIDKQSLAITGENACSTNKGGCEQICLVSGPTSRVCRCAPGYVLEADALSCRKVALRRGLIVSDQDKKGIYALDLDDDATFRLPVFGHANPKDIAFDKDADLAFWTDNAHKFVAYACVRSSCAKVLERFEEDGASPEGLAIDKGRREIYIVDAGILAIRKMTYSGTGERILISTLSEKPRSIALDPVERMMYWTDWGNPPKIERASMDDGSRREDFVTADISWPNGLAIDLRGRRLFWTEGKLGRIEVQNLNGTNRQTLLEDRGVNFLGLTYGHNTLYYSITNKRSLYSLDLQTKAVKIYGYNMFKSVFGLDYFSDDSFIPPTSNPGTTVDSSTTDDGQGGGLNQTLIIALSVSMAGVVLVICIIVIGVICYKRLDAKIGATNPAFNLMDNPATSPAQPKPDAQLGDPTVYDVVINHYPPGTAPRPPAPLPLPQPQTATAFSLPPLPPPPGSKPHPFLGPVPDVVGPQRPPPLPVMGGSVSYSDRPQAAPDYAGLLSETRSPPPVHNAYTNMRN